MSICCGWGWQPPQTASHTQISHTQRVWSHWHWYAVNWHTVTALHSFTHPTWLIFWGSVTCGVESRNVVFMSWLRLAATSNCFPYPYYTYNMFEHIDMLSIGIQQHQPYTVIPILVGSYFGVLGHLWSQNDVITSWLRLRATSNCFPHPH